MKAKKLLIGALIVAALLFIVAKADWIAGIFGPVGDLIVALAVVVLAAVFILVVLLPLLGFIFVGMSLVILLVLLAVALSVPFTFLKHHKPDIEMSSDSEVRSLSEFEQVLVLGDLNILVVSGGGHAVALKGDGNDLAGIKTEVKDNRLIIRGDNSSGTRVAVSMNELKAFNIEGAGQASLQNLNSENFNLDMEGTANVEAAGSCQKATIHLAGAGSLNAHDLHCDEVDIILDGTGSARIYAAKHLNAKIKGTGQVSYAGNPEKIDRIISGLGQISPE